MKRFKDISKFSKSFLDKRKMKRIKKIKDDNEKTQVLQNSLLSELKLKHLNFELKLKKIKDRKKKQLLFLKSQVLHSKISLLRVDFNEKDFKKINYSLDKLEEELKDA